MGKKEIKYAEKNGKIDIEKSIYMGFCKICGVYFRPEIAKECPVCKLREDK